MSDCKMISCKLNRECKENHKKLDQIFFDRFSPSITRLVKHSLRDCGGSFNFKLLMAGHRGPVV